MSTLYVQYPARGVPVYPSASQFPLSSYNGALAVAADTDDLYVFNGTNWVLLATPASSPGAIDALTGDVTATGPGVAPATVVSVGGESAGNVATATGLVLGVEPAHYAFIGPTSGGSSAPTWRLLVSSDIPNLSSLYIPNVLTTAGDLVYENSTPTPARLPIGTSGQVLTVSGGLPAWATPTTGTVTSVALADGSSTPIYSITGSPVTSTGTLTFTLNTETANQVFAGPTSGGAAQPTFRPLVSADLPAGTGTVTSVALTMPSIFSVTGSPVTSSGTLAVSLNNETANTVWAGPASGGPAAPTFRALVASDIPSLSGLYANVTLSNLTSPTAVNQSLLPATDNTLTLGNQSGPLRWADGYFGTLLVSPLVQGGNTNGGSLSLSGSSVNPTGSNVLVHDGSNFSVGTGTPFSSSSFSIAGNGSMIQNTSPSSTTMWGDSFIVTMPDSSGGVAGGLNVTTIATGITDAQILGLNLLHDSSGIYTSSSGGSWGLLSTNLSIASGYNFSFGGTEGNYGAVGATFGTGTANAIGNSIGVIGVAQGSSNVSVGPSIGVMGQAYQSSESAPSTLLVGSTGFVSNMSASAPAVAGYFWTDTSGGTATTLPIPSDLTVPVVAVLQGQAFNSDLLRCYYGTTRVATIDHQGTINSQSLTASTVLVSDASKNIVSSTVTSSQLVGLLPSVTTPGSYPYTVLSTDKIVQVDTSSARTIQLPASTVIGQVLYIKDHTGSATTFNITVNPNGSQTIDGMASASVTVNYGVLRLYWDGSNWYSL